MEEFVSTDVSKFSSFLFLTGDFEDDIGVHPNSLSDVNANKLPEQTR